MSAPESVTHGPMALVACTAQRYKHVQHSTAPVMLPSPGQHGTAQCCIAAASLASEIVRLISHLATAWRAASAANAACLCSAVCVALRQQSTYKCMCNDTNASNFASDDTVQPPGISCCWVIALLAVVLHVNIGKLTCHQM